MRGLIQILTSILLMVSLSMAADWWAEDQRHMLTGITPLVDSIEARHPDVVLLGNSILHRGVDDEHLSSILGRPGMSMYQFGAASAWWFLALKNVVAAAEHKPRVVVILFRDQYLTQPTFRTQGNFKDQIDMLRREDEPVLEHLAGIGGQTPGLALLNRYWPFYQVRSQYRRGLERQARHLVSSLLGVSVLDLTRLTEDVFSVENLDKNLATAAQLRIESVKDEQAYDFESRMPSSFLPEMMEIAREQDLTMGFIRFKRLRDTTRDSQSQELVSYVRGLREYLESQGSFLIDFTDDQRLERGHYADGDHLNEMGKRRFSEMIAGALREHLPPEQQTSP